MGQIRAANAVVQTVLFLSCEGWIPSKLRDDDDERSPRSDD
jgi:hypothetical protein